MIPIPDRWIVCLFSPLSPFIQLTMFLSGSPPPESRTASPRPQFEEDDIQVQYHPNSQRPTQVFHFEDYGHGPGAPTVVPPVEPEPWYPFRTRIDFEFAELVLEAALTHQQMDRLFDLVRRTKSEQFMLWNRKDVRDTWDAASFKLTPVCIQIL